MPKGGARKGAGRKARPSSKSKLYWCGQHSEEDRDFIMQWLSPDERFSVLMAAANKACKRRGDSSAQESIIQKVKRVRTPRA